MKKKMKKDLMNLREQILIQTSSKEVATDFDDVVTFVMTDETIPYLKWLEDSDDIVFFIESIAREYAGLSEKQKLSDVALDVYVKNFARVKK